MNIITNIGNEFYKEPSLLNASAIAQIKRKRGLYNFKKLPPAAILIHKNVLSRTQLMLKPVLKGLEGNHYRLNKHYTLSTGFGNGAPAIVSLMEELRALGVRSFIFAGFAGSLLPEVKTGEAYFVKEAIASVGCAAFYSPQQKIKESANLIHYHLIEMLQLKETVCRSTDAPDGKILVTGRVGHTDENGNFYFTDFNIDRYNSGLTVATTELNQEENPSFVYPNPVTGLLYITVNELNAGDLHFTLTDITGKILLSAPAHISDNKFSISCSNLTSGVYLINLFGDGGNLLGTEKIVVIREE